jgi:hypothetical protein
LLNTVSRGTKVKLAQQSNPGIVNREKREARKKSMQVRVDLLEYQQ